MTMRKCPACGKWFCRKDMMKPQRPQYALAYGVLAFLIGCFVWHHVLMVIDPSGYDPTHHPYMPIAAGAVPQ